MPTSDLSLRLAERVRLATARLQREWPEAAEIIRGYAGDDFGPVQPEVTASMRGESAVKNISLEERTVLHDQLLAVTSLPPGRLASDAAEELQLRLSLQLHQQVILSATADVLPYTHGKCCVLDDTSASPAEGLYVSPKAVTAGANVHELPVLQSKMLLLQPHTGLAAVVKVAGILTERIQRYQFGTTKRIAQDLNLWSPGAHGNVVAMLFQGDWPEGTIHRLSAD